jgi:hypothetical protein
LIPVDILNDIFLAAPDGHRKTNLEMRNLLEIKVLASGKTVL